MIGAFRVQADPSAQEWIRNHSSEQPRVIAYDVKRCCGGGKLCTVSVRERRRSDDRRDFATAVLEDGTRLLVDRRAARRLPSSCPAGTNLVGMDEPKYISRVRIVRERGPVRRAYLPAEADPVMFGTHDEVREHYGTAPGQYPDHATTLDYVVA